MEFEGNNLISFHTLHYIESKGMFVYSCVKDVSISFISKILKYLILLEHTVYVFLNMIHFKFLIAIEARRRNK